jgi:hypothetical protein
MVLANFKGDRRQVLRGTQQLYESVIQEWMHKHLLDIDYPWLMDSVGIFIV